MTRLFNRLVDSIAFWISIAILARLACIIIGVHSDIIYINYFPSKLVYEGVWDVYDYIRCTSSDTWTYYPPITYYVIGGFQFLFKSVNIGFNEWINALYLIGCNKWLLLNGNIFIFFKNLLFMKLPYVFFDCIMICSLWRYGDNIGQKKQILRLWSINPVILYGIYLVGQMDIMPATLIVLAILCIKRNNIAWAFFALSIAALFKTFALFIFLPFWLALSLSGKERIRNALILGIPCLIVVAPFYFSSRWLFINAFFPPFEPVSLDAVSNICFFLQKVIFLLLYVFILKRSFDMKRSYVNNAELRIVTSTIMALYILFFVPVHYFVWVIPVLMLCVCYELIPRWLYWLQIAMLFLYNLNSANTTTRIFAPVYPDLFCNLQGLPDIMHMYNIRWGVAMLGARLIFVAISIIMSTLLIGKFSILTFSRKYGKKNLY